MRKNLLILTKIEKEKPEDYINITDRKINKKPLNSVKIKEENQS